MQAGAGARAAADAVAAFVNRQQDLGAGRWGGTALYQASGRGFLPVVLALLEAGAEPDHLGGGSGETPLSVAARKGHVSVVRALLSAKANPSATNPQDGTSPLYAASQVGYRDVVDLLIAHGANVNQAGGGAHVLSVAHGSEHRQCQGCPQPA